MERIDPIGSWLPGIPQVDRVAPSKRSGERRQRDKPPPERNDEDEEADDRGEDDGHSHIDVSA
jgi:hypothetical protein